MFTSEDVAGVFALMPTPALDNASDWQTTMSVDLPEAERATETLIGAGVDAIMTTGTFGEGATLTWPELQAFADVVVSTARERIPIFIGTTTLNTRDTIERTKVVKNLGATGVFLGRPMWVPCDDRATVSYYSNIADAVPEMAIVIYDNPVAFKGKISTEAYAQIAMIDQVVAAKYRVIGSEFSEDVDAVAGRMRLMPIDQEWWEGLQQRPNEVPACWSSAAPCGPAPCIALRNAIAADDGKLAQSISTEMRKASATLFPEGQFELFSRYNIGLGKARINEAGFIKAGPTRPPYHLVPDEYLAGAREAGRKWRELHERYAGWVP